MITSEAEETVVSVTAIEPWLLALVYEIQYSMDRKWIFEKGPIVPVVKVFLVAVVDARTFVVLSQFLNRNVHDPRMLVEQLQTVIQALPTGPAVIEFTAVVRSKVQVPD